MFFVYFFLFYRIVLSTSLTKTTEVIVRNLEDKCIVICKEDNYISSIFSLEKLVLRLRTDPKSLMIFNLDRKILTLMYLQFPCTIEGYNKNGKLVLNMCVENAKHLCIGFKNNPNAAFQFISESIMYYTNTLDFKLQAGNAFRSATTDNIKMALLSTPEEKTFIAKENDKYVLYQENNDNKFPRLSIDESSPNALISHGTRKRKIKFNNTKDLVITFSFSESCEEPLDD
ncbi:putative SP-containing protein [Vairimorpha necatrix]|uniref:SP-containing protein n=1 Tax=Vairimorpha necatrix TaxID=6039 RepID=A0AAX4J8X6_9MICR